MAAILSTKDRKQCGKLDYNLQPVWSSYPPKRQSEGAITFALVSLKKKTNLTRSFRSWKIN